MRETIRLGEGDGIAAVRYKLEQARSSRVSLVVPRGSPLLRSEVDLALVRHLAESLALDVVLVTEDRAAAAIARSLGLRTATSTEKAPRGLDHRAAGLPQQPSGDGSNRLSASAESTRPTSMAVEGGLLAESGRRPWAIVLAGGAGVLLLLLLGFAVFAPSATVALDPKGDQADIEAMVLASTDLQQVDYEQGQVPARQVQIEIDGEESGQSTGKRSSPDQHASGEVVFANKTTEQVDVPKGTVVRTNDGVPVKFYTLLDVQVPGSFGATARAPIMAFDAGPGANVEALTIRVVEGEPAYKVDVLNDQPTRGGNEKRVGIVASQDYDRLRASLMQRLQQQAYDTLVQQLDSGEWIPQDSLEVAIAEEAFDKKLDEPAEALRLTMKVRVTGLAVQGEGTRKLLTRMLEARSKGLVVNDATLQVDQPVGNAIVDGQLIRFKARARALLVPAIDLRTVSARVAGQSPERALTWLTSQYDLRQAPEIQIWPRWWPLLPKLPYRIQVHLGGGL